MADDPQPSATFSSPSPPHSLFIKGALTSPDSITAQSSQRFVAETPTSAPPCHCTGCAPPHAMPTWSAGQEMSWQEMRTCAEPRHQLLQQHHHHHHHHHHYQFQWPAACCSALSSLSSSSSSPPLARQADPLQVSSHTSTHTHSPLYITVNTHTSPFTHQIKEHTHTVTTPSTFHLKEHTHNTPSTHLLKEHTHITPSTCHLTQHTHITPFTFHLTHHTDITPLPPSLSLLQNSTHVPTKDIDLYAIPPLPLKKPKRPSKVHNKLLPPFPSPSAPPYIICQHCSQLLSLPSSPPLHMPLSSFLKLKCALCMRTSFFSVRCQHAPSSSDAAHLRDIAALESAQIKVEHRSLNADVRPIDSSTDGGFHLKAEQRSMNAHAPIVDPLTHGGMDAQVLTNTGFQFNGEHEITNTDVHSNDILTEVPIEGTYMPNRIEPPLSPPKLNPEFAGFSSVQDWVNSLEQDSFLNCPTPAIGEGFGSDLQLQGPLHWQLDGEHESENFVPPVPGSPLHEHFGYKSPTELLNKTLSSDDEIKARSDTTSNASTSGTSANTFNPPGFDNVGESAHQNRPHERVSVKQGSKTMESSPQVEQDDQRSLAKLFKRSFKSFGERKNLSMSSPKSRIIVNGHALSQSALSSAEKLAGRLRPGAYWYDSKAGFWGITGGPCLGVLPPFIEELHHPMARDCSNGDTQVFVNGRELHHKDLAVLASRGLSRKPGRSYAIGFDGVVVEETSGQELKHIGKLAPTVERRGKGYGMCMAKLHPSTSVHK